MNPLVAVVDRMVGPIPIEVAGVSWAAHVTRRLPCSIALPIDTLASPTT